MNTLQRIIAIVLLLVGALTLLLAILEVWRLYLDPTLINALTQELAKATGIDARLPGALSPAGDGEQFQPMMVSYFLAWGLALILLSLAARMGFLCVKAGKLLLDKPERQATPANENTVDDTGKAEVEELPLDYQPSHRRKAG